MNIQLNINYTHIFNKKHKYPNKCYVNAAKNLQKHKMPVVSKSSHLKSS